MYIYIDIYLYMKVKSSVASNSATPWTVAHQAPPSMESSRQEYWSGMPFPSPGDLSDPGIKPGSPPLRADALPSEPPGKPPTSAEADGKCPCCCSVAGKCSWKVAICSWQREENKFGSLFSQPSSWRVTSSHLCVNACHQFLPVTQWVSRFS